MSLFWGGRRHLAAHPNGKWLYLICEMSCEIIALNWDPTTSAMAEIGKYFTLPADYPGVFTREVGDSLGTTTADIHVSPDGRFVTGSNRMRGGVEAAACTAEGSIVVFAVQPSDGSLELVGHYGTGGITPRNFALHLSGKWLLAANSGSDNVVVFAVNQETGALTPHAQGPVAVLGGPLCIQFVQLTTCGACRHESKL